MTELFIASVRKFLKPLLPGCTRLEPQYEPREIYAGPENHAFENKLTAYPLISIVVPSFNQGRYIRQTLKSITEQNYPNLELIVVDGGSSDETLDVIQDLSRHFKWWSSEADSGQANAINKGIAHAAGEILAWLNSDDCLMPGALFRVAERFMSCRNIDVVYGHRILINEAGQDVGKWILPGHSRFNLGYADFIPQETMFWRAEIWQKAGGYVDESFRFAMDWELISRFVKAGAKFSLIPAFLGQFRMHDTQKSHAHIDKEGFEEMELIRQKFREDFSSNIMLQKKYVIFQRVRLYAFLLRARLTELLWRTRIIRIN
jgi:glycosyltransferase involved in cell wall biosynthesis